MVASHRIVSALLLFVLASIALFPQAVNAKYSPSSGAQGVTPEPDLQVMSSETEENLMQQARQLGSARVIVRLKMDYQTEGNLAGVQAVQMQRAAIQSVQNVLLERLSTGRVSPAKTFQFMPYVAFSVDEQGLALLKTMPEVASIEEDLPVPAALAESVSLIGATPAQTAGYTGLGQTVAILDTGVDKSHPFLAGKVVSEACYSTTDSAYSSTTVCPDGSEASIATGSGVHCSVDEGCNHGTHVAGIAAGKGASFSGVAADASIIAVQVFSRFNTSTYCGSDTPPCIMSFTSDQILGLERVYALRDQYNIAAVNMSLGGEVYTSTLCDYDYSAMRVAIDNLRVVHIATVISAGNDGATNGISAPACISSAISVGSTRDGSAGAVPVDAISSFSNSSSGLEFLAPGEYIYSSIPGGQYATYQGTSMAAPHVTGAWAVLKSKRSRATVDQVFSALMEGGVFIRDPRNSINKPRIQVDAALSFLSENRPIVSGFSPYSGPPGTTVDIYGSDFSAVTAVQFLSKPAASFEIVSAGHVRAVVPEGAVSGVIGVTAPAGQAKSTSSYQTGENSVSYTLESIAISGTKNGALAWADYDGDGKQDVLITGEDGGVPVTRLYHNEGGGSFSLADAGLPGATRGAAAWADIDNDGNLDLLLTGAGVSNNETRLFINQNGNFTEALVGFPALSDGAAQWGDFDLDGDLDLALSGQVGSAEEAYIYRNDGGWTFTNIHAGLVGMKYGSINWVDYDEDGDVDLFLTGQQNGAPVTKLYQNDGIGNFADTNTTLAAMYDCSSSWSDYDNDGDQDLLLAGVSSIRPVTKIYRNDGSGSFSDVTEASIPALTTGTAAWGDYDNDGDPDILLAGSNGNMPVATIYKNQSGTFSEAFVPLHGIQNGQAAWGDFDGDQDLDILLLGETLPGAGAFLYRNASLAANTPPSAPGGLTYIDTGKVALQWNPASDTQTPASGLSYNLRVGRTPGGSEILAPGADPSTGLRRLPAPGNVGHGTSAAINGLPFGSYYWAVQAVDASLAGSPFSAEQIFTVAPSVYLQTNTYRVAESIGQVDIVVMLNAPAESQLSVGVAIVDETAVAGNDYMAASSTLTFDVGETSKIVTIDVLDDGLEEVDETFLVNLSSPSANLHIGNPGWTRVTILDNDGFENAGVILLSAGLNPSAAWGDYDNDGDLDLAISGRAGSANVARIYRNDNGAFVDVNAGLPDADYTYFLWIDYDNDSDLDLLYSGRSPKLSYFTEIYRNSAGVFTSINAGLPAASWQHPSSADYDNDGDLDLFFVSWDGTSLYQNVDGSYHLVTTNFPSLYHGPAAWGDYDNDGYVDLLLTGSSSPDGSVATIYHNSGNGSFFNVNAGLQGVASGTAAWGDYDNDGDLDVLIAGCGQSSSPTFYTLIYRNDGNSKFTDIQAGLPGSGQNSTSQWGDYDNDGDLDILVSEIQQSQANSAKVFRNDGGVFADIGSRLGRYYWGPGSWADYDNDGDLDLLIADATGVIGANWQLYRNKGPLKNTPPTAPGNLSAVVSDSLATLSWNPAVDGQTPPASLTYNLRIGTYPRGENISSSMSDTTTGYRRTPLPGNIFTGTTAVLKNLSLGQTYYWAVQAVDGAYAGSPFSVECTFTTPMALLSFSSAGSTISESQPLASIPVQLSRASYNSVTVHYETADGSAAAGSDYTGSSGTLVFGPGETLKNILLTLNEDTLDEENETIHLSLSNPTNAVLGTISTTDITIQDNDNPPTIKFVLDTASIDEGDGSVTLTAMLTAASGRTVTVNYSTEGGTATAERDYSAVSGLLTFAPGETSQTITVPVLDDALKEPAETFLLALKTPTNASPGLPNQAAVTIYDNDSGPVARFSASSYSAVENDGYVTITVNLSPGSSDPVTVDYATGDLTGAAGVDYLATSGRLTFSAETTSQSFTIDLVDDAVDNEDKTVNLVISNPTGAMLGSASTAVLTIQDDDPAPAAQFETAEHRVGEGDGVVPFAVSLSAVSEKVVTVRYHVTGGSAAAGEDYTDGEGLLTFAPGETTQELAFTIFDDARYEGDETVQLALFDWNNAAPGQAVEMELTIADNDPPGLDIEPAEFQIYLPLLQLSD